MEPKDTQENDITGLAQEESVIPYTSESEATLAPIEGTNDNENAEDKEKRENQEIRILVANINEGSQEILERIAAEVGMPIEDAIETATKNGFNEKIADLQQGANESAKTIEVISALTGYLETARKDTDRVKKVENRDEQKNSDGIDEEMLPRSPEELAQNEEIETELAKYSPEQKEKIEFNFRSAGYELEARKNKTFSKVYHWAADKFIEKKGNESTMGRFLEAYGGMFDENMTKALKSKKDLDEGKGTVWQKLGNIGAISGNTLKYGRMILGPARWAMMLPMLTNDGFRAGKEARFENEELKNETREEEMEKAAEEAWSIYETAMRNKGMDVADEKNPVSADDLEKAYAEHIPADLRDRLSKFAEADHEGDGITSRIIQKGYGWWIGKKAEKFEQALKEINDNPDLTPEAKALEKEKYLSHWGRSKTLADFDRMVTQEGAVDAWAGWARVGEKTSQGAVYAMMGDSIRRTAQAGVNLLEKGFASALGTIEEMKEEKRVMSEHPVLKSIYNKMAEGVHKGSCEEVLKNEFSQISIQEDKEASFFAINTTEGDCVIRPVAFNVALNNASQADLPGYNDMFKGKPFDLEKATLFHTHPMLDVDEKPTKEFLEMVTRTKAGELPPYSIMPPGIADFRNALVVDNHITAGEIFSRKVITSMGTWEYAIDEKHTDVAKETISALEHVRDEALSHSKTGVWDDVRNAAVKIVADDEMPSHYKSIVKTLLLDSKGLETPYTDEAQKAYTSGDLSKLHEEMSAKLQLATEYAKSVSIHGLKLTFVPHESVLKEMSK